MTCCLTAPSHYLNQCWVFFIKFLLHSPSSKFTASAQITILYNGFENYTFETTATHPMGQWVKYFLQVHAVCVCGCVFRRIMVILWSHMASLLMFNIASGKFSLFPNGSKLLTWFVRPLLSLTQASISNHMPGKVLGEITYPCPNFSGCTVEVWRWISISPHFIWWILWLIYAGIKVNPCEQTGSLFWFIVGKILKDTS